MDQKLLISLIESAADIYQDLPIMQQVVVTQAIHESNFLGKNGGSVLALKYNNLFGIKAKVNKDEQPLEPAVALMTWEHIDGQDKQVRAWFAWYEDHTECFQAHRTLMEKPRYAPVLAAKNVLDAFIQLKKCGYATDPGYPTKLSQIWSKYVTVASES